MSKNYGTIKTNVGTNVQDTSSAMDTIIGNYVNNRYFDVLRRANWEAINFSYSFTLPAAATMVTLPSDFNKEVYAYDYTNQRGISHITLNELLDSFSGDLDSSGNVDRYTIIDQVNTSGLRYKIFRPHYIPASTITVKMPYTLLPLALASNGGYTVIPCEDAIELGATADAWRYKRQFAKAQDFEQLYEKAVAMLAWNKENQNQIKLFSPKPYDRDFA